MNKITQSLKVQIAMVVMLCMSVAGFAQEATAEVNGIFYRFTSGRSFGYENSGVWKNSEWYPNVATVIKDPNISYSVTNVDTYQGDVVIPEKVTYNNIEYTVRGIESEAFRNCRNLTSLQLPSTLIHISSSSFANCVQLAEINLPKAFWGFESSAFNESSFTAINVDEDNPDFTSEDGVLYDKNMTKVLAFPTKKTGSYRVPSTVTSLSTSVVNNVSINELIIPASVTEIKGNNSMMYYGTTNEGIKKLVIEDGDTELEIGQGTNSIGLYDDYNTYINGYTMFNRVENLYLGRNIKHSNSTNLCFAGSPLTNIEIGAKVTRFPKYSFVSCYGIQKINVKGGFKQWCDFDFTQSGTNPLESYGSAMPGMNNTSKQVLFDGQELLGDFVVPTEITKLPSHALQAGCSGVTSLTLHDGITEIGDGAFRGLSNLKTITITGTSANFKVVENVLYDNGETKILCFPQLRQGDYDMPSTITTVAAYQFYHCTGLTGITLSENIADIGISAFEGCTSLPTITIPASVDSIGSNAFNDCTALTKVVIEDADAPITLGRGSKQVQEGTGSAAYTYTRSGGLFFAAAVTDVYIGRNLIVNGTSPFTEDLVNVTIGNKVTEFAGNTFKDCTGILRVDFDGSIIDWCNITFANQYATPFGNTINDISMYGSTSYTPSSTMYTGKVSPILYVREGPLHSQVNVPSPATKIGAYAFFGQLGVSTVTIPATLTTIEPYAFYGIEDVYFNATSVVPLQNSNTFTGNVYVTDNLVPNYRLASEWSKLADRIYPMGFLQVTVDLVAMSTSPALLPALNALEKRDDEYRITKLTNLKIRGTMNGYDILMIRTKMPNLRHLDLSEASILANDGGFEYYTGYHTVENTISDYSFYQLDSLRSVILPNNITRIGAYAFAECKKLQEVGNMPESCTYIGYYAFANSGLRSIVISKGVKNIEYGAFRSCYNLSQVGFNKGLETIGWEAFSGSGITELVLPTTLRKIGGNAFSNCGSLSKIDFAEGLDTICSHAFSGCYKLKNLRMPTSLSIIEDYAFNGCSGLTEVHVPSMITHIGDYAFTKCGLKAVYAYTLVPVKINQNTFDYKGVDLYAPDNSFYAYYINTQWSQFQDVKEFEALYTSWYTSRYTDVTIRTDSCLIKNADNNNPADGIMEPGSGLIFVGDGEQLVKNLILNWQHGYDYPALIEDNNLSVEELKFILNVYPGRWYFFCFPFDVNLTDVTHDGKWVWRYYDSEERAENGKGGWKNVTDNKLKANVGYIFQSNAAGDLQMPIQNPNFAANKEVLEDGKTGKNVQLQSHESANAQDASWNFVGNPNLSYYNLDDMGDFGSPVTVWDDEQKTYTAVVPGDDEYEFHPFEAFFIQKPADSDAVTFKDENRETSNEAGQKQMARRKARARRAVNINRLIVNVELSNDKMTDKTRVVFDDSKDMGYEAGCDANKFMSHVDVPQIYTLDAKNVKYAVNNRPNMSHEVNIGISVPADGDYRIDIPRMDYRMSLKDLDMGITHDFSNGAYIFHAKSGAHDKRFVLVPNTEITNISEAGIQGLDINAENGGIEVNGINDETVNIYNTNGVRVAALTESGRVQLSNGTYIVSLGRKATKVLVK